MTVLKYYIEEKFNPVPITFNTKNVKLHFEKRKNLIENHLKIPLFMFKVKMCWNLDAMVQKMLRFSKLWRKYLFS